MKPIWYLPWSYSRSKKADGCPWAFEYQYKYDNPSPSGPMARIGQAVHEAIHRYTLHCQSMKVETDIEYVDELLLQVRGMLNSASERAEVAALVGFYIDRYKVNPKSICEYKFGLDGDFNPCDYDSDICFFRGRIDNHYQNDVDEITLVDYFTGWTRPDEAVKRDQLRWYALALFLKYPDIEKISAFVDFLRFNETVDITIYRDEIQTIKAEIMAVNNRYAEMTEVKPEPCGQCENCFCWRLCPKMKEVLKSLPDTREDAETLLLINAARDQITKRLKDQLGKTGAIEINGQVLGFHGKHEKGFDRRKLTERLERYDQNAVNDAIFNASPTISETATKKVVRSLNAADVGKQFKLNDFEEAVVYKSGTRFEFRSEEKAEINIFDV